MSMAPEAYFGTAENNRRQHDTGPLGTQLSAVEPSATPSVTHSRPACTKRKLCQATEAETNNLEDARSSKRPRIILPYETDSSEGPLDWPDDITHSEEFQELPIQPPGIQPSPISPESISQPADIKRKCLQDSQAKVKAHELEDVGSSKHARKFCTYKLSQEILTKDSEAQGDGRGLTPSNDRL